MMSEDTYKATRLPHEVIPLQSWEIYSLNRKVSLQSWRLPSDGSKYYEVVEVEGPADELELMYLWGFLISTNLRCQSQRTALISKDVRCSRQRILKKVKGSCPAIRRAFFLSSWTRPMPALVSERAPLSALFSTSLSLLGWCESKPLAATRPVALFWLLDTFLEVNCSHSSDDAW